MKLFGYEIKRLRPQMRNYTAAKSSNLTADWLTSNLASDEILRWQLPKLVARSRDLAINNDYMRNFLRKLKVNVVGPEGFTLQLKSRLKTGELDKSANTNIETAWRKWGKNYACVCGPQSLKEILNCALESTARDGEILLRIIKGYDNPFAFALQLIESDHLDNNHNETLSNGNKITMGIEKDTWGKPVAYHLWKQYPWGGMSAGQAQGKVRIPANEIIHLFVKERPTQSRGAPWAHTALLKLRMLGAYEEAAVVNARVGASKMQSVIMGEGVEYTGDNKDPYGNIINEVEPGMREVYPAGTQIHDTDFAYPSNEFGTFNKAMLRGIASGLGCSYNSLANDLEGVNFSSLRSGLLEERDGWKTVQTWLIEKCLDALYPAWLEMALLSGQLQLSYSDVQRFTDIDAVNWQARRWEWIDPEKDINAKIIELKAGLTTRQRILSEKGEDFEEILEQLKEEQKLIDEAGLQFNLDTGAAKTQDTAEEDMQQVEKALTANKEQIESIIEKTRDNQKEILKTLLYANKAQEKELKINIDNKPQDINLNLEIKQEQKLTTKRGITKRNPDGSLSIEMLEVKEA